ncbi:TPA: hypothetical protein UME34_003450 [Stenotrophomonas maltophilia]|nr:hypothetical protein [Stenotrophomonas maltophilia]
MEDPTTFAGGDSSCAREITACQSFVSMASGDLTLQCQKRHIAPSCSQRRILVRLAVAQPFMAQEVKLA